MSGCEEIRAELDAYLDGELDEARAAEVGRHIDGCPACADALAELRRVSLALRRLPAPAAPQGFVERFRQARLAEPVVRPARSRLAWAVGSVAAAAAALLFAAAMLPGRWSPVGDRPAGRGHRGPDGPRSAAPGPGADAPGAGHGHRPRHAVPEPKSPPARSADQAEGAYPAAAPVPAGREARAPEGTEDFAQSSRSVEPSAPPRMSPAGPTPAPPTLERPLPAEVPSKPAPAPAPVSGAPGEALLLKDTAEEAAKLREARDNMVAALRPQPVYAFRVLVSPAGEAGRTYAGAAGGAGERQPAGTALSKPTTAPAPAPPAAPGTATANMPGSDGRGARSADAVTVRGESSAEAERRLLTMARSLGGGGLGSDELARRRLLDAGGKVEYEADAAKADGAARAAIGRYLAAAVPAAETKAADRPKEQAVPGGVEAPGGRPEAGLMDVPLGAGGKLAASRPAAGASRTLVLCIPAGQLETFERALAYWGQSPSTAGARKPAELPANWLHGLALGAGSGPDKVAGQEAEAMSGKAVRTAPGALAARGAADPAAVVYLLVTLEEAAPAAADAEGTE